MEVFLAVQADFFTHPSELDPEGADGRGRGGSGSLRGGGGGPFRPPLHQLTRQLSKGVACGSNAFAGLGSTSNAVVSSASAATTNLVRHVSLEVSQAKKDFNLGCAASFVRSSSLSQACASSSSFSRSCGSFSNLPTIKHGQPYTEQGLAGFPSLTSRGHHVSELSSSSSASCADTGGFDNYAVSELDEDEAFGNTVRCDGGAGGGHSGMQRGDSQHHRTFQSSYSSGTVGVIHNEQSGARFDRRTVGGSVVGGVGSGSVIGGNQHLFVESEVVQQQQHHHSSSISCSSSSATLSTAEGLQIVQQKQLNVTNSFPNLVDMSGVTQGPGPKKKLPRTLSTSALRIKTRSPFWEKFWNNGQAPTSGSIKQ